MFGKKTWKSDPKALFALTTETAKWSQVLSEVLEKSGVLGVEKNVCEVHHALRLKLHTDLVAADTNSGPASRSRPLSSEEGHRTSCLPWLEHIHKSP